MTATNHATGNSENGRRDDEDNSSIRLDDNESETMSNADLYSGPPTYTLSAAHNEVSLSAEAYQPGKSTIPRRPVPATSSSYDTTQSAGPSHLPGPTLWPPEKPALPATPSRNNSRDSETTIPLPNQTNATYTPSPSQQAIPTDLPPAYFEQLTQDAALASIRRCSILSDRPAIWLVKKHDIALCPLSATILVKEGLIRQKDLELISLSSGTKRDPTDPLSGIAFATYDTVGDILLGLVQGPAEVAKQVTPMLLKHEEAKRGDSPHVTVPVQGRQESSPLVQENGDGGVKITETRRGSGTPSQVESEPRTGEEASPKALEQESSSLEGVPHAAAQVALSTGKGLGRIVGASLKAPMAFTHSVTRGFHNVPKLYGGEVRDYENVVGLRSGLSVSGKGLAYGVSDGLKDFFVQPIVGAQKEGVAGFAKGVGKGIGNLAFKPAAGACGVLSYSLVGVYKELQGLKPSGKNHIETFRALGETEYAQTADQTRLEVVRSWCQMTMRQNRRS